MDGDGESERVSGSRREGQKERERHREKHRDRLRLRRMIAEERISWTEGMQRYYIFKSLAED